MKSNTQEAKKPIAKEKSVNANSHLISTIAKLWVELIFSEYNRRKLKIVK